MKESCFRSESNKVMKSYLKYDNKNLSILEPSDTTTTTDSWYISTEHSYV